MRVMLKGVHTTRKTLADGSVRVYYYAWKNGPRIKAEPGTPAFAAEYHRHMVDRKTPDKLLLFSIIAAYKRMELPTKAKDTQRSYLPIIRKIEDAFGDMPIAAVEERGSRALFMEWRNEMADRPRTADLAWSVLQRIMSFGVQMEMLDRNPCENAGRLADSGTRREKIWGPAEIARMRETAPARLMDALLLALWTGQRQGDLLRLTWANYDGTYIRLRQSKSGKNVTVQASKELKAVLDRLRAKVKETDVAQMAILTNSRNQPWTGDGFRTSWAKATEKAKVTGLTFHDLRGTFVTNARRAGSSVEDIAQITGHTIKDVRSILEQHYLADDPKASAGVILKMERKGK